jgi:hypothetical protein
MITTTIATSGDWALGSDGVQWILYHRRSKEHGGWVSVSFVRSERSILARCMREKGCPVDDAAVLLKGLPQTFDEWIAREPVSYSELERRRSGTDPDLREISADYPPLPSSSPWAVDPVGPEPLIDRTEDQ